MFVLWLALVLAAVWLFLVVFSVARVTIPLEPAMTPGDLGEARDPEHFSLQEQAFREDGFVPAGDYLWHDGMTTTAMRVFWEGSGRAYGWAVEESTAGVEAARRSVSVLTEYVDGTLLDTTSSGPTQLALPAWFRRETVPGDTALLLRRHRERQAELARQGGEIRSVSREDLQATIIRNERRIGEYQAEIGRMRLVAGKLRYRPAAVARMVGGGILRMLSGPWRRFGK